MNQNELSLLTKALSNDARVLYLLGLRPNTNLQTGETDKLQYKSLMQLLNGKENGTDKARFKLGRQINSLLKELHKVGLIALDQQDSLEKSMNGKQLILPLLLFQPDQFAATHIQWQSMTKDWSPETQVFVDICQLIGLIDKDYTDVELGEFIAYWLGRPDKQFSQYQWTHKFVMQLKQKRLAGMAHNTVKVGQQLIETAAGIQADDNAKALVKKYSK